MTTRLAYTTAMSDKEWQIIAPLIPGQEQRGRKIDYSRREIVKALFYLNRNGCQWRDLPHDFPPYRTVSHYYHQWRQAGIWQSINDAFRTELRVAEGRDPQPSAACLDSQSVKTTEIASVRGYDAAKKIKGVKRHILVDTLGFLLIVVVHAASIQDREGAKLVLSHLPGCLTRLKRIWADGGYRGKLVGWVRTTCQCVLEIVKPNDDQGGFKVLPHRWVVERTFGWLNRYRRLARDYERLPQSSEAMVHLAMIRLMLRRLERHQLVQERKLRRQQERVALSNGYALAA